MTKFSKIKSNLSSTKNNNECQHEWYYGETIKDAGYSWGSEYHVILFCKKCGKIKKEKLIA
jgi:hypothetical protein